jgi:hypothetical protein
LIRRVKLESKYALEVYSPAGIVQVTNLHARRLDTLNGKTICELSDGIWEHDRTFPKIRELLLQRFPNLKIIPYTELPTGNFDIEDIGNQVKKLGCDGVIVGNAA